MRTALTLLAVAVLAGCATRAPETRYYTLDMQPSGDVDPQVAVKVDRLLTSEPLARRNLLIQTSPTEVEYYALDEWAAGVAELVTKKLEAEFGAPEPGERVLLLYGTVLDFEQVDRPGGGADAHARIELAVRAEGASRYESPLLERVYVAHVPLERAGPREAAEALSRAVERVAAAVASDIGELR
jgi:uncharacterized lipoprotein YmbA